MSNILPIKTDQALEKIAPYYRPIFQTIVDEYIMPNERILFVADATRHSVVDEEGVSIWKVLSLSSDISTHKDVIVNQATLLIVTNFRWLRWSLEQFTMNYSIKIERDGNLKFEWVTPPASFPHEWLATEKKKIREFVAENITIVKLSDVEVGNRKEFTVQNNHTVPISELHLVKFPTGEGIFYSFKFNDGILLHKLIQIASMNNHVIPIETKNNNEDNFQKLKQLKAMLDNNLITPQEYETKKTEILSRM